MMAAGSRGPEAFRPFSPERAEVAGHALAAALANDWPGAMKWMAGMTAAELETLWSVTSRLGRRARGITWTRRTYGPRAEGAAPCGHVHSAMWLTRKFVCCPCGQWWSRDAYPDLLQRVQAINPAVHCRHWRPGDPSERYHGADCRHGPSSRSWSRAARRAVAADEDEGQEATSPEPTVKLRVLTDD